MHCPYCGKNDVGVFCSKCGKKMPPQNDPMQTMYEMLALESDETSFFVAGKEQAKSFYKYGWSRVKGWVLLSDKYVYFKGRSYAQKRNRFHIQEREKVFKREDLRKVSSMHYRDYDALTYAAVLFLSILAMSFMWLLFGVSSDTAEGIEFIISRVIVVGLTFVILSLGVLFLWKMISFLSSMHDLLVLTFKNETIALDMQWLTKQEVLILTGRLMKDRKNKQPPRQT